MAAPAPVPRMHGTQTGLRYRRWVSAHAAAVPPNILRSVQASRRLLATVCHALLCVGCAHACCLNVLALLWTAHGVHASHSASLCAAMLMVASALPALKLAELLTVVLVKLACAVHGNLHGSSQMATQQQAAVQQYRALHVQLVVACRTENFAYD